MDTITSGVTDKALFHLTPRHEVRVLNGLAPELTKAQAATLTASAYGFKGLGADSEAPQLSKTSIGIYAFIGGLIAGYALFGKRP